MGKLHRHLTTHRNTPQTKPIPGREAEMERMASGGYAFKAGDWERLDRFLILGTEGGTYYATEGKLTVDAAGVVMRCLQEDPLRVLATIGDVALQNRAPKNGPSILAVALAFTVKGDSEFSELRRAVLGSVCRTGTHFMEFLDAATALRGGGRALNGAVRHWLAERNPNNLAFQMTKYRQRSGWTWRDVLRRFRPRPGDDLARQSVYRWAVTGDPFPSGDDDPDAPLVIPDTLSRFLRVQAAGEDIADVVRAERAPWEWVPTEATADPEVLEALFESMPVGATIRQLSKLTARGVLPKRLPDALARLGDVEALRRARVHPVNIFTAQKAYEAGSGRHLTWHPIAEIVDALDDAFRHALDALPQMNERLLIAVDTSGSMGFGGGDASRLPCKPIEIAAALALVLKVQAPKSEVIGFDYAGGYGSSRNGWRPVTLSPRMRCMDSVRAFGTAGGGTDCSIPFQVAKTAKIPYEGIVVLTDGETWAGDSHVSQLRKTLPGGTRVAWCSLALNSTTLVEPGDTESLTIAGWSSDVPRVVGDFLQRRI